MTLIRLRPITQWARNRIHQHGDTFEVLGTGKRGTLVRSLRATWKGARGMETWTGWFEIGKEAEVIRGD